MSTMQDKRVPVAWSARWRRIRLHTIPIVCFVIAVTACGWLWQRRGGAAHSIGRVSTPRVDVTSPSEGLVVALPRQAGGQWNLYDHVQDGDVIARFDDRPLTASKALLRQEIRQLIDQIDAWQAEPADHADTETNEAAGRVLQAERSRLSVLDQLLAGAPQSESVEDFDAAGAGLPESLRTATRVALERFRDARRGIELRWEELSLRAELLEVRAPISGTLVDLNCWPGQAVRQGAQIATIAADYGNHITTYLPEDSRLVVRPGMQVTVSSHATGSRRISTTVERVGEQIEQIPARYEQNANAPLWGLPVRIKLPSDTPWRPGALVEVAFQQAQ
jgi:multidrug resistance efflux pump